MAMRIIKLVEKFQHYIKKEMLFQKNDSLLIAVSGGVDSVVLCELCSQSHYKFSIAHCNFRLRKEESDEDEDFVRNLSVQYGVTFYNKKFNISNHIGENKTRVQVTARNLRYDWFSELLSKKEDKKKYLLTAHHANDNIETLMMNFFRGTGITGLQGILPKQNYKGQYDIIRPLLFARKPEIIEFAKENNLQYRNDSSNTSNKYTRNYFRNELLPALQHVYPEVEDNLLNNIHRFKDIYLLYNQALLNTKKKLIEKYGNEIHIPVLKLLKTAALPSVIYEIIKEFGFSAHQSEEVIKLLNAESGKYIQSATHRILRNRAWLIISPLNKTDILHYIIEEHEKELIFKGGLIKIEKTFPPVNINPDRNIALLDASFIKFPLLVRKWKQGDYFYPLGMQKKKKLSRFFTDQKLSLLEKENIMVVESDKKILWIAGQRIDDRYKIKATATNVLKLTLFPSVP